MWAVSVSEPGWSYGRHTLHEQNEVALPSCYSAPASIDAWRHRRMLATLAPLLEEYPAATWLTVGDGAYGSDAHYLQSHGATATASSLTDGRLSVAQQRGYIRSYCTQNAEALSAADDSYDFVLCKESYHHFPRPPLAFYEMLRVARRAAIFIEPVEGEDRLLDRAKKLAKRLLRGDSQFDFEPSGNFIFRASVREMAKMLTALNGPSLAFRQYNDFYYAPAAALRHDEASLGRLITGAGLLAQDLLCRLALLNYGLATIVVFKRPIENRLADRLRGSGFKLRPLPRNPYV